MGQTKNPLDAERERRESDRFRAEIRAANLPSSEAPSREGRVTEPPFPKPIEAVLHMPSDTEDALAAKRLAAREWLVAYCARARFVLDKRDLRLVLRTKPDCQRMIDQIRPWVPAEDLEKILEGV